MKSIITFLTAFFILECCQAQNVTFIEIKITNFMFRIVPNGRSSLAVSGDKLLPLGLYKAKGLEKEFRQVAELIEKINFFELAADEAAKKNWPLILYPPMSRITVEKQGKKIFLCYSYPNDFKDFDDKIFEIVKKIIWEKIN